LQRSREVKEGGRSFKSISGQYDTIASEFHITLSNDLKDLKNVLGQGFQEG
jgi:hypothetical protein